MKDVVIRLGKPKRVSKSLWENRVGNGPRMPKESKWDEDAQRGRNGPRDLTSNVMGQEILK